MDAIFQMDSDDDFQKVAHVLISNLYYVQETQQTQIEQDIFDKAKLDLQKVIMEYNFDLTKVSNSFKGWDQDKVKCFQNLLEQNWSELLMTALNHYNSSYGETVSSFDWIVKFVLGTSELKTMKYPLLQLILLTVDKKGQNKKNIYDVNKDMLVKLINVLEKV